LLDVLELDAINTLLIVLSTVSVHLRVKGPSVTFFIIVLLSRSKSSDLSLDFGTMALLVLWMLLYASVSLARHEEMQQLDESPSNQQPFHYNMMVNTSAEDADLDRYLWKGIRDEDTEAPKTRGKVITYSLQSKLGKRAVTVCVPTYREL
jgi:hypothetical protein